ncbi:tRNA-specific adenosine deaminase 1 [Contarinia nasturtii]|uniref:tRNA-specific adenosine deaminase 1 n=1 Tax=Contarinia nasturtii TaxID=265458 RepID=UPI0012D3EE51|nr:tRNA-specific adenosine deaminase 1 [Contarinia nasturtii]
MLVPDPHDLAKLCLRFFDTLPKTGKPKLGEWTVLCCCVKYEHRTKSLEVVSVGTGTKCVGRNLLSNKGDILHDCHAEIMCRRGFLTYLYEEINLAESFNSIFTFNHVKRKFEISKDISFHFFSTKSPCGDASIFSNVEPTEHKRPKLEQCPGLNLDPISNVVNPMIQSTGYISIKPGKGETGAKLIYKNTEDPMIQSTGYIRLKPGKELLTSTYLSILLILFPLLPLHAFEIITISKAFLNV